MRAPLSPERLSEIRAREQAATPGEWRWFGNVRSCSVYLATARFGRTFVMQFWRWGMQDAQPAFRVPLNGEPAQRDGRPTYGTMRKLTELAELDNGAVVTDRSGDICDITHPDAAFIAHARQDIPALLDEVERLTRELDAERARLDYVLSACAVDLGPIHHIHTRADIDEGIRYEQALGGGE